MGNWKNRLPRKIYRQYNPPWSPPRVYHSEPIPEYWQDGIQLWEKRFCTEIGSIPWRKIVDAKKFMYCYDNVLNWNDSASEEAFHSAKKRFWAEINGFEYDPSLPDPDMYIDKINWNSNIDTALIEELDREYFGPQDEVSVNAVPKNKKTRNSVFVPTQGDPNYASNPWERAEDEVQGWNQGHDNSNSWNLGTSDNPWEHSFTQHVGVRNDNAWENSGDKLNGWDNVGSPVNLLSVPENGDNPWERGCQGLVLPKDNGWGHSDVWGNFRDSSGWDNVGSHANLLNVGENCGNPWEQGCQSSGSRNDKGWGCSGNNLWRGNINYSNNLHGGAKTLWDQSYSRNTGLIQKGRWNNFGGNGWRSKQWNSDKQKNAEFKRSVGGREGARDTGFQRTEGSHNQYVSSNYRSSRFQGDANQIGPSWRRDKNKKRGSFYS